MPTSNFSDELETVDFDVQSPCVNSVPKTDLEETELLQDLKDSGVMDESLIMRSSALAKEISNDIDEDPSDKG